MKAQILVLILLVPLVLGQSDQELQQAKAEIKQDITKEHVRTRADMKKFYEEEKTKAKDEILSIIDGRVEAYKRDIRYLVIKNLAKLALVLYASTLLAFVTWDIFRRKLYKRHVSSEQILESPLMKKLTSLEAKLQGIPVESPSVKIAESVVEKPKDVDTINELYDEIEKSRVDNLASFDELRKIVATDELSLLRLKRDELRKKLDGVHE